MWEGVAGLFLIAAVLLYLKLTNTQAQLGKLSEFTNIVLLDPSVYEHASEHMGEVLAAMRGGETTDHARIWALRTAQISKATRYIDDSGGPGAYLGRFLKADREANS